MLFPVTPQFSCITLGYSIHMWPKVNLEVLDPVQASRYLTGIQVRGQNLLHESLDSVSQFF